MTKCETDETDETDETNDNIRPRPTCLFIFLMPFSSFCFSLPKLP